jgi:hypothetical protein
VRSSENQEKTGDGVVTITYGAHKTDDGKTFPCYEFKNNRIVLGRATLSYVVEDTDGTARRVTVPTVTLNDAIEAVNARVRVERLGSPANPQQESGGVPWHWVFRGAFLALVGVAILYVVVSFFAASS